MGLTTHKPEESLLPKSSEGIIAFDIHISAINKIEILAYQTLRQMSSNITTILPCQMVTSHLIPPRDISPTMSSVTFRVPLSTIIGLSCLLKQLNVSKLKNDGAEFQNRLVVDEGFSNGRPNTNDDILIIKMIIR